MNRYTADSLEDYGYGKDSFDSSASYFYTGTPQQQNQQQQNQQQSAHNKKQEDKISDGSIRSDWNSTHPYSTEKTASTTAPLLTRLVQKINTGLLAPKLFYFFYFCALGSIFPFIGIYFKQLGLSPWQVGFLVGFRPLVEVFSTCFWGHASEKWRKWKLVLLLSLVSCLIFTMCIAFVQPVAHGCFVHNGTDVFIVPPYTVEHLPIADIVSRPKTRSKRSPVSMATADDVIVASRPEVDDVISSPRHNREGRDDSWKKRKRRVDGVGEGFVGEGLGIEKKPYSGYLRKNGGRIAKMRPEKKNDDVTLDDDVMYDQLALLAGKRKVMAGYLRKNGHSLSKTKKEFENIDAVDDVTSRNYEVTCRNDVTCRNNDVTVKTASKNDALSNELSLLTDKRKIMSGYLRKNSHRLSKTKNDVANKNFDDVIVESASKSDALSDELSVLTDKRKIMSGYLIKNSHRLSKTKKDFANNIDDDVISMNDDVTEETASKSVALSDELSLLVDKRKIMSGYLRKNSHRLSKTKKSFVDNDVVDDVISRNNVTVKNDAAIKNVSCKENDVAIKNDVTCRNNDATGKNNNDENDVNFKNYFTVENDGTRVNGDVTVKQFAPCGKILACKNDDVTLGNDVAVENVVTKSDALYDELSLLADRRVAGEAKKKKVPTATLR